VGLGSVIESLPRKTHRKACDLMADIVATGLVSDPDAEALIKTFVEPPDTPEEEGPFYSDLVECLSPPDGDSAALFTYIGNNMAVAR
jgi:hypothetical protein